MDITFCRNNFDCPRRQTCRRADESIKPLAAKDFYEADKKCEHYWRMELRKSDREALISSHSARL
jgi:hypothetical protein